MPTHDFPEGFGRMCVLDIETAPDPLALAMAGKRGGATEHSAALHYISDASALVATEDADGHWRDFEMRSFSCSRLDEVNILRSINGILTTLWASGGTLVTYNGVGHDMIMLQRRAARHLMFDLPGIATAHAQRHLDIMLMMTSPREQRWSKLREVAAGLGIPTSHQHANRGLDPKTAGIRKSQTDVSMTFLVSLFELSMRRQDAGAVIRGWRAFGEYIARMGPHGDHLAQFRRHPLGGSLEAG